MSEHTKRPLEVVEHYVRTAITAEDRRGLIIAEFYPEATGFVEAKANAILFVSAHDLLNVAQIVIETATIETPIALLEAARAAIAKVQP